MRTTPRAIATITRAITPPIRIQRPLPPSEGRECSRPRVFGAWTVRGGGGVRLFFATARRDGTCRGLRPAPEGNVRNERPFSRAIPLDRPRGARLECPCRIQ